MSGGRGFIALGRVGRPFGMRGEIRVRPYNPDSDTLCAVKGIWIGREHGEKTHYDLISWRWNKDLLLLCLSGISDHDQASALRGAEVFIEEERMPALAQGEFYWYQLIGLAVWQGDIKEIGKIVDIYQTAPELDGNDVFVVETERGEVLIPAIEDAIEEVDLINGRLIISPDYVDRD